METNNLIIESLEKIKDLVIINEKDPAKTTLYLGILKTLQVLVGILDEEYLQSLILSCREAQRELEHEAISKNETNIVDDLFVKLNKEIK